VVVFVAGDIHIVDHVLDQEQAPAARRLHTLQLGLQVRRFGIEGRWPAPLIGDLDGEIGL
jgi:hypothetical protein